MVEVEEVELLEGTLHGEEGLLVAGEVGEAAWTEVGEAEAGVSTSIFHLYPVQNRNGVYIDFKVELAYLSASKPLELCSSRVPPRGGRTGLLRILGKVLQVVQVHIFLILVMGH